MANKLFKLIIILFAFCFTFNIYALEETETTENTEISELSEEEEYKNKDNPLYVDTIDEVNDNENKCIIEDDANLLSEFEKSILKDEITPLTKYGHVLFKTINSNSTSTKSYADKYYHDKVGKTSGTLFLIDMDNREIYIFSDGKNYDIITSDKAYIITDNVYRYASDGKYYKCASAAFSQILSLLEGNKIAEPMRHISNAVLSITFAAFVNFFIVLNVSKKKISKNSEIIKKSKVNVVVGNVKATKTGTKSVYSPVSDSGGSSSSGGGGGGGSSGGGGGHGF